MTTNMVFQPYLQKSVLDNLDVTMTGKRDYKLIGEITTIQSSGQDYVRCEYNYPKLEKFCNWIKHKLFNEWTDRDVLKYNNAKCIVNHIRTDLKLKNPDISDIELNNLTDDIISRSTKGKVRAITEGVDWQPFKSDEEMPVRFKTKHPHAINSGDIQKANEMLHHAAVFGTNAIKTYPFI